MQITFEELHALPLPVVRKVLPVWVATHVADDSRRPSVEAALLRFIGGVGDAELAALRATFFHAGEDWRLFPADPAARVLTRTYMDFLVQGEHVEHAERLRRFLSEGPPRRIMLCNHLSYTDTQVTDRVLVTAGFADVADRLVAIAGPKVYTDPWRRLAAVSLNTRKTPQSNVVATEQDALSPRELAAIAFAAIDDCHRLADQGFIPLLYPEGARSRSGRMRPFLRASARYLSDPDVQVLPVAQTGSEHIFPIGETTMHAGPVRVAFGEPFAAADYPGKTGPLREGFRRLVEVLPPAYRPEDDEVLA